MKKNKKSAYARAGVDIEQGDRFVSGIAAMVKSTQGRRVIKVPNGYAGLYDLDGNNYIAATTDGVGTKLKIAFDLRKHDTVGVDLVAMSVNDLVCVGARPLFFLDYFATGRLKMGVATSVLKGITNACLETGVALIGGETAEMPGFYADGEYDLGGFSVGIVNKKNLIDGERVTRGDSLIGIASSGIHSNGFSLVRKLLPKNERHLLKQALTPTRLYVAAADSLFKMGSGLHGLAHITGSGFLNIPRLNEGYHYALDLGTRGVPPLFAELQRRGSLSWQEMFTTFNMGVGMVVAVAHSKEAEALKRLQRAGYDAFVVGRVCERVKRGEIATVSVEGRGVKSQRISIRLEY